MCHSQCGRPRDAPCRFPAKKTRSLVVRSGAWLAYSLQPLVSLQGRSASAFQLRSHSWGGPRQRTDQTVVAEISFCLRSFQLMTAQSKDTGPTILAHCGIPPSSKLCSRGLAGLPEASPGQCGRRTHHCPSLLPLIPINRITPQSTHVLYTSSCLASASSDPNYSI